MIAAALISATALAGNAQADIFSFNGKELPKKSSKISLNLKKEVPSSRYLNEGGKKTILLQNISKLVGKKMTSQIQEYCQKLFNNASQIFQAVVTLPINSMAQLSLSSITFSLLTGIFTNTSAVFAGSIPIVEFQGKLHQIHRSVDGPSNAIVVGSSTNGNNWGNWQLDRSSFTLSAPTIASFNGRLYQAHRGSDNGLYISDSSNGTNWSAWRKVSGGIITRFAPTMAAFNSRLYLSHVGTDNAIYTSSSIDGITWSPLQRTNGSYSRSAIALIAFKNRLYESHRGTDNAIYTRSSSDGINWTGWQRAEGTATQMAPTFATFNGRLYTAHQGSGGNIYTRSTADGVNWSAWQAGPSITKTYSPAMMAAFGGRLYQTHQGNYQAVFIRSTADGINWTPWQTTGASTPTDAEDLPALLQKVSADYFNARPSFYTTGNPFWRTFAPQSVGGTAWPNGNCTWYAHGRVAELGGSRAALSTMRGNAGTWGNNLSNGAVLTSTPKMGDIAEFAGHVAVVEQVNSDGTIVISESSWAFSNSNGYLHNVRTIPRSSVWRFIRVPGV